MMGDETLHTQLSVSRVLLAYTTLLLALSSCGAVEKGIQACEFENPPTWSRAGALWVWLNGNVDLDQITRELEEMKERGMRGVEIWDVGSLNR